jgi:hypothetical protein
VAQDGPSLVDIDTIIVRANATGGQGGLNGQNVGQTGGARRVASPMRQPSHKRRLDVVTATLSANATGGQGGSAANGGLNGGAGGSAVGGFINVGHVSGASDTRTPPRRDRRASVNQRVCERHRRQWRPRRIDRRQRHGRGRRQRSRRRRRLLARGAALTVTGTANLTALGQGGQGALDGGGTTVRTAGAARVAVPAPLSRPSSALFPTRSPRPARP